jgi:glycosyltransferase involved in cell wall biosynthesis
MPTRRHCMVVDNTWPDFRVERESRALVAAGWEVDVVCLAEPGEPRVESADRLTIHRLPVRRRRGEGLRVQLVEYLAFLARAFVEVLRLDRRRRYLSVQVHNVPDFLVFAGLGPRLRGARLILDLHDLMPEFFASRTGGSLNHPLVRLIRLQERLSCAIADRVITVTDLWRDTLAGRGVPDRKLHVVMNLPDPGLIPGLPPDAPRPEPPGPPTVLYHGTLTRRYGIDVAMRAVADVSRERDVRFLVHGRGEALPELQALAGELGLDGVVEFSTRFMPTGELPQLLGRAHVGVVTYRRDVFTDGILPTKLLEYAARGIPTVVGRTPVIERYFDESAVRFVDGSDVDEIARAIRELLDDPDARESMSRRAREIAARHTWPDEAAGYVRLIEDLTLGAGRPAVSGP